MSFASRKFCVVATVSIVTAGAVVACVPPLPGGALDDGAGRADGDAGSGGAGNGTGAGGAPGAGIGGASGPGIGGSMAAGGSGASGPGIGGSMAAGGSGGSPFLFVNDAGRPMNLAVDTHFVYWDDGNTQSIMRAPLDGGPSQGLVPLSGRSWVAVDSNGGVYWSVGGNLMKLAAGGAPTMLAGGSDTYIQHLVVGPDAVFWITVDRTPPSSRVLKVGLDGGPVTELASGQTGASAIALDATNVYWSTSVGGKVMKLGLSGGEPITLATSASFSSSPSLAVDATSVYWIDASTPTIMKVNVNGGQPEPALAVPAQATSVAVDGLGGIYWTDSRGSVYVAVDPKTPRLLGQGDAAPALGVLVDAANVYWISTGTGSIFRAPK